MSSAAFIALCNDQWGEALQVRFKVLFPVLAVDAVEEITIDQEVVSVSAVARKREKKHGIMQGQAWQIQCTNIENQYTGFDFKDAIGQIVVEFIDAGEWEAVAQGRIYKVTASTNGTITFEIHDTVIDLLNYEISRDIHYQATGWLGEMQVYSKDPDSKGWDSTVDLTNNTPADLVDEAFTVTFTSATAFDVTRDGGAGTQSGTISVSKDIDNTAGTAVLTIPASGWSVDSGAYTSGDTFVFYTAEARTATQLTPVQMIMDLIDIAVPYIDVVTTPPLVSVNAFYSATTWSDAVTATSGDEIGGFWKKGTPMSRMIQDALKVIHGAIYTVSNGMLALWHLQPNTATRVGFSGDPDGGPVNIIEASMVDDITEMVSSVTYEYLDLEGNDAAVTSTDSTTALTTDKKEVVKVGWRVRGLSMESAANIHLNRFKNGRREYQIKTTLAGMLADVSSGIYITEPDLNLTVEASDVTEITMDLLNNTTAIKAHVDPVVVEDYAIVDISTVGGTEVVW